MSQRKQSFYAVMLVVWWVNHIATELSLCAGVVILGAAVACQNTIASRTASKQNQNVLRTGLPSRIPLFHLETSATQQCLVYVVSEMLTTL